MPRYLACIGFALMLWADHAAGQVWPSGNWSVASPAEVGMDEAKLQQARDYALTGGGSGIIVRGGYKVYSWGDQTARYDLKSTTKSIGGSALGLAIADNFVALPDFAQQYLPTIGIPPDQNAATGWLDQVTILQLATHTAGLDKTGGFIPLIYAPGTVWSYSDGGANWLADLLTQVYREDLSSLLFRRVFSRLGITSADLVWRSNLYRGDTLDGVKRRELASGISADVDAMARVGYLYLRDGLWAGERLLPTSFIDVVRRPSLLVSSLPVADPVSYPSASRHYGVLWFTNADGTLPGVPTDAYWSWGLLDSLIVVIPSLDIVAVRAGSGLGRTSWNADYSWIAPFITPIAQSVASVTVPNVVGLTQAAATAAITNAELVVGTVTQQSSAIVTAGSVISQSPSATTSVATGSAVNLVVSTGAASVTVSVAPTSLAFGNQALNLISTGMTVAITNTGTVVLPIGSITLTGTNPGQFSWSTSCPSQVPVDGACTATVVFKPTATGTKLATLTIALGGGAADRTVALSGIGVRSSFSVSSTSLTFGNVARGTTSIPRTVTIMNTGIVVLPMTSITLTGTNSGQFARTNNCPAQVEVGGSCTVDVVFKPTSKGSKTATLKVTPGGGASAKTVALSGTGI